MGQDSGQENGEVKILIIAKSPKNLKNTCEFLARTGWQTTAMNNIPKALEFIKDEKPTIVLISFNHTSDSIYKLPELLEKTGEILCIGFVEGTDVISSNTLTSVKMKNKIFGQPSGANIQRGISQILAQWTPTRPKVKKPDAPPATVQTRARSALTLAFGQICPARPPGTPLAPLTAVKKVGVFRFDSSEMPGYLVLGQEPPPSANQDFLKLAESAIASAFANSKLQGKLGDGFWLDFPDVEFKTWAAASSAFNLTCDNEGVELGIAFFQVTAPLPLPRPVKGYNMLGIGVEQIAPGEPLPFKLYLHMETNQKFYMYLRNGRELQSEQLERLNKHKVKEIFIKTLDLAALNQFWAKIYLKHSLPTP